MNEETDDVIARVLSRLGRTNDLYYVIKKNNQKKIKNFVIALCELDLKDTDKYNWDRVDWDTVCHTIINYVPTPPPAIMPAPEPLPRFATLKNMITLGDSVVRSVFAIIVIAIMLGTICKATGL